METRKKKITLKLVGIDGNAFAVLGAFKNQAKKEAWTKEEIDVVIKEAMSGDYNHLLATIMDNCQNITREDENEYDEELEDDYEDDVIYCVHCGSKDVSSIGVDEYNCNNCSKAFYP